MGPTTGDIQQQANELAEYLLATNNSLPDWVFSKEPEFTDLLDEQVICCDCCNWWVARDEATDDEVMGTTFCDECMEIDQ